MIDVAADFNHSPDQRGFFIDPKHDFVHLNARGHKRVTELMVNYLLDSDFLPSIIK